MLQLPFVYGVPNIVEIGQCLLKLQWNKKCGHFLDHCVSFFYYYKCKHYCERDRGTLQQSQTYSETKQ